MFTSNLNEAADNESWAIRDFELLLLKCPEKCDSCKSGDENECQSWVMYKWSWIKLTGLSSEGWTVEKGNDAVSECGGI